MKDRRPRTVSGGGQDASAATLCGLAEIEPCDQTQPKIIIDFGQITVLVGERRMSDFFNASRTRPQFFNNSSRVSPQQNRSSANFATDPS